MRQKLVKSSRSWGRVDPSEHGGIDENRSETIASGRDDYQRGERLFFAGRDTLWATASHGEHEACVASPSTSQAGVTKMGKGKGWVQQKFRMDAKRGLSTRTRVPMG